MNIIITGVSKGLGLETTKLLLSEGYTVYGISRSSTQELEKLKGKYKEKLKHILFDIGNTEEIRDVIFKNWIGFDKPIHGLVNNAAIAYDDIATNLNMEPLEDMFKVNVYAPFTLTKFSIRHMLLHNTVGSIVHISSVSVHTGYKGLSMYAATKGALEAYSKNIAREWGQRKVRSNCIVAGFMDTEMSSSLSEDQKNRIYARTSAKAPVDPTSVAETISFLVSDKSNSITGQNIHVDCGTI